MKKSWLLIGLFLIFVAPLVSADNFSLIKINNNNYDLKLDSFDSSKASLIVNDGSIPILGVGDNYKYNEELNIGVSYIKPPPAYVGGPEGYVTVFVEFQVNMTLNYNENNLSVECYNDSDCAMPSVGVPYCKGDELCISGIEYECMKSGTIESFCSSNSIEQCNSCSYGCENSKCLNTTIPNPIPSNCDPIGLRKEGNYCSSEKIWIEQKESENLCENNFECKSNSCLNGSCQSKVGPNYTLWITIVVIILIVIGTIIFFLRPRNY